MKIKVSSNRPKTQRDINTSTRPRTQRDINTSTRATQRRTASQRTSGKKVQKQDNTKLFIGIGVAAFFILFIIIAAASGGSDKAPSNKIANNSSSQKKFNLPVDVRKQIYAEYVAGDNKIEDEAQSRTGADRSKGADIRSEVDRLKQSLRIELREKWKKKYPKVNSVFIKNVINEGIDKNWSI